MRYLLKISLATAACLGLGACGSGDGQKSGGTSDAVEVLPGTISDDMIILDQIAVDGTAVDSSLPKEVSSRPATPAPQPSDDSADSSNVGVSPPPASSAAPAASPPPAPATEKAPQQPSVTIR